MQTLRQESFIWEKCPYNIRKYHNVENGDLKCPKCDKSFRKYDQLYKHVTDYHPKIEKLTPCRICGIMIVDKRK